MSWIIVSATSNPYINAATEEYLLKHFDSNNEPIIYLWQNDNTIVVGRNQNVFKEINLAAVQADAVNLFRRFSGGGTVYHDMGNLNYTFIDKSSVNKPNNYATLAEPIIAFLESLGVNATFKGRNDLEIDGMKFSGNAQYVYQDKLLHHGTLLFNLDFSKLMKYLNVDMTKLQAKGIDSVRKRVTNIADHLPENNKITIQEFTEKLRDWFIHQNQAKPLVLDEQAHAWIKERAQTHFSTWEWNYAQLDETLFRNKKRFDGGSVELYLNVQDGLIKSIKFAGDFLSTKDLDEIYDKFINQRYMLDQISQALDTIDLPAYFGSITKENLLELMFDNGTE